MSLRSHIFNWVKSTCEKPQHQYVCDRCETFQSHWDMAPWKPGTLKTSLKFWMETLPNAVGIKVAPRTDSHCQKDNGSHVLTFFQKCSRNSGTCHCFVNKMARPTLSVAVMGTSSWYLQCTKKQLDWHEIKTIWEQALSLKDKCSNSKLICGCIIFLTIFLCIIASSKNHCAELCWYLWCCGWLSMFKMRSSKL